MNMMGWLLKFDGYPPGVAVALLLHGLLLYLLLPSKFEPADMVTLERPSVMIASAIQQNPQRLRRIEQQQTRRQNEEAERERQRQAEAESQRQTEAERQRQADADRQRQADADRQRQADTERQRQADAERQRQADAERQQQVAEAAAQAAAQASNQQVLSVENQLVAQYMAIIQDLVSRSWSRPPGARNDMTTVVQLRLTPTGEVVDRDIIQSSGNEDFDRSVLQAVDRVGSFPELQDMPTAVFERNFRTFNLDFSPEDLLR